MTNRFLQRRKSHLLLALLALIGLMAAACGDDDETDSSSGGDAAETPADEPDADLTVGFAWTDTAIDVYKPLISGAREEAEARGYTVLESNNGGDPATQIADVQTWVAQGVTGVVILPLDPAATGNVATEASEAGVFVIGYSDPIEGADGSTTFNHVQGGQDLGQNAVDWIAENIEGTAKIGLLVIDEMQVGRDRIDTAMSVIEEQVADYEVVSRTTAVSAADALPAVQSMLQLDPELNVIFCVADDGCIGAAQAFEAADIDPAGVYMAGWDGALPALEQIRSGGYIKADAALDLTEIGRSVVYTVDNARTGGETNIVHDYVIVDGSSGQVLDDLIAAYGS